jgi:hypothetical protein
MVGPMASLSITVTRPTRARPGDQESPCGPARPLLAAAAVGILVLAVPLAASGAFYGSFALSDGIAPGVTVAGLSVGGLTVDQVAQSLDAL